MIEEQHQFLSDGFLDLRAQDASFLPQKWIAFEKQIYIYIHIYIYN